jgi:hypothetical protein
VPQWRQRHVSITQPSRSSLNSKKIFPVLPQPRHRVTGGSRRLRCCRSRRQSINMRRNLALEIVDRKPEWLGVAHH